MTLHVANEGAAPYGRGPKYLLKKEDSLLQANMTSTLKNQAASAGQGGQIMR